MATAPDNESQTEVMDESEEIAEEQEDPSTSQVAESAITTTDWTTEVLVNQMKKGIIELNPNFQRRFAWTDSRKSEFIESLALRYPVPHIVLARDHNDASRYIVLDGKQRLMTLAQFYGLKKIGTANSGLTPLTLSKLKVKKDWSGETYESLKKKQGQKPALSSFENATMRAVVIMNWSSEEFLYSIFVRLNQGSLPLSPQELRQALKPGPFVTFADTYASKSAGLKLILNITKPDFRMRDVELLIRFLSFRFRVASYKGNLKGFLDDTCQEFNANWKTKKSEVDAECKRFETATTLASEIFGKEAVFRKFTKTGYEPRINRAIFDVVSFALAEEKVQKGLNSKIKREKLRGEFEKLCLQRGFLKAIESTTKSLDATKTRFTEFLKIVEDASGYKVPFNLA